MGLKKEFLEFVTCEGGKKFLAEFLPVEERKSVLGKAYSAVFAPPKDLRIISLLGDIETFFTDRGYWRGGNVPDTVKYTGRDIRFTAMITKTLSVAVFRCRDKGHAADIDARIRNVIDFDGYAEGAKYALYEILGLSLYDLDEAREREAEEREERLQNEA